ncbi:MAG: hypothetical protein MZU95_09705 [Desulfomicrobium escambiense]|nr:hypothetical protein [Desulfomicrobium escambiense]
MPITSPATCRALGIGYPAVKIFEQIEGLECLRPGRQLLRPGRHLRLQEA